MEASGEPTHADFPTSQPKTEIVMFQATHWWPLSCKWKGGLTSKQCSNCTSWSLEQGQLDLLLIDSSIHSKPLGGIFALVLNYCLPASDKTSSKPSGICLHLLAWHSVFSQCSSRTPRIFPSACLFFFFLFVCLFSINVWKVTGLLRQVKGSCSCRGHSEFSPRSQLGFLWKNGWGRGVLMSLAG